MSRNYQDSERDKLSNRPSTRKSNKKFNEDNNVSERILENDIKIFMRNLEGVVNSISAKQNLKNSDRVNYFSESKKSEISNIQKIDFSKIDRSNIKVGLNNRDKIIRTANLSQDQDRLSHEKIREARSIVKGFKESSITIKTREKYKKLSDRLDRNKLAPEKISGTKNSFYVYRAAEIFRNKVELKSALRDRDKALRERDSANRVKNIEAVKNAEQRVIKSLEFFSKYQPGGTREENLKRENVLRVTENSDRSNAKRESISKIPSDWREKVWREIAPRDRDALAVTAITGLRPSELERGVRIRKNGENFEFRIRGTKVDNLRKKGQEFRVIKVAIKDLRESSEGQHLLSAQRNVSREVKIEQSAKAFTARINRAGERAMPQVGEKVSPYSYRHAFSARLKSDNRSPQEIAKAMGHRAERSQQEYGRKSQAKNAGNGGIVSASAARPVRSRC
jgi:integrase